jgi:DNA-binding transcriptional regulator GbsR (MarR family)
MNKKKTKVKSRRKTAARRARRGAKASPVEINDGAGSEVSQRASHRRQRRLAPSPARRSGIEQSRTLAADLPRGDAKSEHELDAIRSFAASVGDFIRYWGFRRVHGQIWSVLYLSRVALSGADLTRLLGVSKALVSPALAELEKLGLLARSGGDSKTKTFVAVEDVYAVIAGVLRTRETQLIEAAAEAVERLRTATDKGGTGRVNRQRLEQVAAMVDAGRSGLALILQMTGGWDVEHRGPTGET